MINARILQNEKDALMKRMAISNDAYTAFLGTMAKFPSFSLAAQTSLHRHAPSYTTHVGAKEYWEGYAGTSILPTAMPIPMLSVDEMGYAHVGYVYDVGDTAGYNQGDESLLAFGAKYQSENEQAVREALGLDAAMPLDEAVRAYVQKQVAETDTAYPDLLAASGEYILREKLGLPQETGLLASIRRDNVALEDFLGELNGFIRPAMEQVEDTLTAQFGQEAVPVAEESEEHENGREEDSDDVLRGVGRHAQGVPAQGEAGALAGTPEEPPAPPVPADVREDDGEAGVEAGSGTDGEAGRDGSPETPERDELGTPVQQRAGAGAGTDDGGSDGLTSDADADAAYMETLHGEIRSLREELAYSINEDPDTQVSDSVSARLAVLKEDIQNHKQAQIEDAPSWGDAELRAIDYLDRLAHPKAEESVKNWYPLYASELDPWEPEFNHANNPDLADISFADFYTELQKGVDADFLLTPSGNVDETARRVILLATARATGHTYTEVFSAYLQSDQRITDLDAYLAAEQADPEARQSFGLPAAQETEPEQAEPSQRVYFYYMKSRPADIGTMPDGGLVAGSSYEPSVAEEMKLAHAGDFYDTVAYPRKLTQQEMNDYDMVDADLYESRYAPIKDFSKLIGTDGKESFVPPDLTFERLSYHLSRGKKMFDILSVGDPDMRRFLGEENTAEVGYAFYKTYGAELARRFGHDEQDDHFAANLFYTAYGKDFVRLYKEGMKQAEPEQKVRRGAEPEPAPAPAPTPEPTPEPETAQTEPVQEPPAPSPASKKQEVPAEPEDLELSLFPVITEQEEVAEATEPETETETEPETETAEQEEAATETPATETEAAPAASTETEAAEPAQAKPAEKADADYFTREHVEFPDTILQADVLVNGRDDGLYYGGIDYVWQFDDATEASAASIHSDDNTPGFPTQDEAKAYAVGRMLKHLSMVADSADGMTPERREALLSAMEAFTAYEQSLMQSLKSYYAAKNGEEAAEAEASQRVPVSMLPLDESFSGIDLDTLDLNATMATTVGARAVFRRNLAAIQIANHLEKTGHQANEKELAVLRSYKGFGGLSIAFDPKNRAWASEYKLAKETFTDSEYKSVKASTLTAFYTPDRLVEAIYDGVRAAGFTGGNVLDPSTGAGAFITNMPEDMKEHSNIVGVELDQLTARVAKFANPDAEVINAPFEKTRFKNDAFDLAITNVPFGNFTVIDSRYPDHDYFIHDYFIRRMLDQVRPGGMVVAITSAGTMDKRDASVRAEVARRANLVRAVRLPSHFFKDAGTDVTTDVLFFQKREKELGMDEPLPSWVESVVSQDTYDGHKLDGKIYINPLFNHAYYEYSDNMDEANILGEIKRRSGAYGPELYVEAHKSWKNKSVDEGSKDLSAMLTSGQLTGTYEEPLEPLPYPEQEPEQGKKPLFGFYLKGKDVLYVSPEGEETVQTLGKNEGAVRSIIAVRDKLRELMDAETANCTDDRMELLQNELTVLYERHVKEYGRLNKSIPAIFKQDATYPLLTSLELYNDEGDYIGKADIFTKRTINAYRPPTHADSMEDALAISLREKGKVDFAYMSSLRDGATVTDILNELEYKEIFEDVSGEFVPADEFLSGDVRQKMDDATDAITHIREQLRSIAAEEAFPMPDHPEYTGDAEKLLNDNGSERLLSSLPQGFLANRGAFYASLNETPKGTRSYYWRSNFLEKNREDENMQAFLSDIRSCVELIANSANLESDYYVSHNMTPEFDHAYHLFSVSYSEQDVMKREAFAQMMAERYAETHDEDMFINRNLYDAWQEFSDTYEQKLQDYIDGSDDETIVTAKARIQHFEQNYAALEQVKPKDLTAGEIKVNLGATWVPTDDVEQFISDTFNVYAKVYFSSASGEWKIDDASKFDGTAVLTDTYGTERLNAVELLERALNHKMIKILDEDKHELVEETILARRKAEEIKRAFSDWVFKDDERKERLVNYYNRHFNNIVPRHFDGSNLTFPGMSADIELKPHQKNAVARTLYGGNTLLAHVVGAGKTFEMQASCMEAKRLGLSHKAAMIMPGHLTAQFGHEFRRLYPNAKILVADATDLSNGEENREKRRMFLAKIASQDWDAVIMNYQQFMSIPLSSERQMSYIQQDLDAYRDFLLSVDENDDEAKYSVKEAEKMARKLEVKMETLREKLAANQDDFGMTFENLGIDRLYVDESHYYKNLGFVTKMSGIPHANKEKTDDLNYKIKYLNEITKERGVVFASGTPISNSISELYILQRYLKPSRLKSQDIYQFDAWASAFGQEVTAMEINPEGTGYQAKTRFSKFNNLPELVSMFREFADVQTADMLDLPTPEVENILEVAEPSPVQKELLQKLSERADRIRDGNPDFLGTPEQLAEYQAEGKTKKGYDNMLVITNDGRKLAIDPRLIDKDIKDDYQDSKLNKLIENVYNIYNETMPTKSTQLIFSDLGTPKKKEKGQEKPFSVYDEIRAKLVEKGIPKRQIAFIHDYSNAEKKERLFEKVRHGDVRILLGSSQKLGVGTNVQDLLIASHDLDCPWRPADIGQRRGRIERRGNQNKKVRIYRYVTNGTFDSFMWQTNERKQRFISQIMTSRDPQREADDVDELVLDYATAKAACTGNPLFKEQMELQNDLAVLEMEYDHFKEHKYVYEERLQKGLPSQLEYVEKVLKTVETAIQNWKDGEKQTDLVIKDEHYDTEEAIGKALCKLAKTYNGVKESLCPTVMYHGISFRFARNESLTGATYGLREPLSGHFIPLYLTTPEKNAARLMDTGTQLNNALLSQQNKKQSILKQIEEAKQEIEKPFARQEELETKQARLVEVTTLIEQEEQKGKEAQEGTEKQADEDEPISASDRLYLLRDEITLPAASEDEARLCSCFLDEARPVLAAHDDAWDDACDSEVVKRLTNLGMEPKRITEALQKFSPSMPTAAEANAMLHTGITASASI